jgi:hypothetical protein
VPAPDLEATAKARPAAAPSNRKLRANLPMGITAHSVHDATHTTSDTRSHRPAATETAVRGWLVRFWAFFSWRQPLRARKSRASTCGH